MDYRVQAAEARFAKKARFAASLRANFVTDARPYQLINDEANRHQHRQAIVEALLMYNDDRECWEQLLRL